MQKSFRNKLLVGLLSALFLTGCGTPIYRQGNLTQGAFEINVPDNFAGAGKEIPHSSSIKGFTLSLNYTTEEEMKMRDVHNAELKESDFDPLISGSDDYKIMEQTKIKDFRYKRDRFPVSFAFTHQFKAKDDLSWGYSIGLDPGFFTRVFGGVNKQHYEIGAYFDLEFYDTGDVSFDYYECTSYTLNNGCTETSDVKHFEEKNVRQARLGGGLYTSFYWNGFAVSYSPMIYMPSVKQGYESELEDMGAYDKENYEFRTRVEQPFVLSQYIGASKWINDHWKVSLGTTLLSSLYISDGVYLTVNSSLGYWF